MRLDTSLTCVWGCRKWILCREASWTYFFRAFCSVPSKDEILKCLTRGRMWLFTSWSRVQPLGVEVPSSYSAGRKRRKGVLEAPQRVFFLHERSRYTILYKDKQHPTKDLTQVPNYRHHCQDKMGKNYSGNDKWLSHMLLHTPLAVRYVCKFWVVLQEGMRWRGEQPVSSMRACRFSLEIKSE